MEDLDSRNKIQLSILTQIPPMSKFAVFLLYPIIWLLSLLPLGLLYFFSDLIWTVMMAFPRLRYRHTTVSMNMRTAFPEKSERELNALERKFYHRFLDVLFESVKSASMPAWWMRRHMRFKGTEFISRELENGNSLVMYLGHMGNWEWISSFPLNINTTGKCCQVYHPLENGTMDLVMLKLRNRYGAESLAIKHVLRTLLGYRKAGIPFIVGMIADQSPLWWDIHYWTDFLNHDTPVLTGAGQLAVKMDLRPVYAHVSRLRRGRYEVEFIPMFEPGVQAGEFEITEKYMRLLEANILESPELWLWTHKRWKRTREGYQEWLKTRLRSNRRDSEKE